MCREAIDGFTKEHKNIKRIDYVEPISLIDLMANDIRKYVSGLRKPPSVEETTAHKELNVYFQDGRWLINNNLAENAIRPIALGRKNWLFVGQFQYNLLTAMNHKRL